MWHSWISWCSRSRRGCRWVPACLLLRTVAMCLLCGVRLSCASFSCLQSPLQGTDPRLELPAVNSYLRRLQHEYLGRNLFGQTGAGPGFYVQVRESL